MKPAPAFYSSPLSAFCAEHLPGDFHMLDLDEVLLRYSSQGITFARATGVLRVIECKNVGEEVRRSQREVLPLLATLVHLGIESGVLKRGSGVFIVEGTSPYSDGADVKQVRPASDARAVGMQFFGPQRMTREQIDTFVRCRVEQRSVAA